MIPTSSVVPLLTLFVRWAAGDERIAAVALVGSYAREEARPDSDVDLVVITAHPEAFREADWVARLPLEKLDVRVTGWEDHRYGILWSRHLQLDGGLVVEVGFAPPEWAAIDPCDEGTRRVIGDGCWILFDPSGLLNRLVDHVRTTRD